MIVVVLQKILWMKDAKMLASLDSFAFDQACIDLIYNSKDEGRDYFGERVQRQHG